MYSNMKGHVDHKFSSKLTVWNIQVETPHKAKQTFLTLRVDTEDNCDVLSCW